MMKLVNDKQLMQFNHDGFWQPMDTLREYILLNSLYDSNNAPWKKW
jgi:glucose-1-phosphate cytidylyltransferase